MISNIEKILDDYHVSMGQYHGRDLEGPACAYLLTNADAIFNRIKELLLEKCSSFVPDTEIKDMCDRYRDLFLLLEGVFHFMQKPNELLSQQDKDDMKRFIRMTMKQWRALNMSVTVKAHVLESHLNNQIEHYHGIGDFNEEFIEQLHQETKKIRKRIGHLLDHQKQINAMVVLNRLENLEKVKEAQGKVATESKRKLSRYVNGEESLSEERRNAKREKQHEDRLNLLVGLGSTDGFGSSVPTNHQRHVADHVGNTTSSNEGTTQ